MLFVKEEGHGKVAYLLFRVLLRRYQIDSFEMAKIDVPPKYVYI